ncbi:MAG TPA: ribbon-helix-helix protein, CopG family [Solirubrobacterales bacterium]|nr:ribbon-helix-helix protein, CopG family [Solirubrobacterales bacterium]
MHRTNIYLEDRQLTALKAVAERRGESVAALIRGALDRWLADQGVAVFDEDEWERRFDSLLARGRSRAHKKGLTESDVERDVELAVREVRAARGR